MADSSIPHFLQVELRVLLYNKLHEIEQPGADRKVRLYVLSTVYLVVFCLLAVYGLLLT